MPAHISAVRYLFKHSLGCLAEENQKHIFEDCIPVREKLNLKEIFKIDLIYVDLSKQKAAVDNFIQIEENILKIRIKLLEDEKIINTSS